MEKEKINLKQLLGDMDRYLDFCRGQGKSLQRIVLTPRQHMAFVKKVGKPEWRGVSVVVQ